MKKPWDTKPLCTRCKKTRTKDGVCSKCRFKKDIAHILARIDLSDSSNAYVWCTLDAPIRNITVVLSARDAVHMGYEPCEPCMKAKDTCPQKRRR
jgi:hypothetical protein